MKHLLTLVPYLGSARARRNLDGLVRWAFLFLFLFSLTPHVRGYFLSSEMSQLRAVAEGRSTKNAREVKFSTRATEASVPIGID